MLKWAVNGQRRSYLPSVQDCQTLSEKVDRNMTYCSRNSLNEEGFALEHVNKYLVNRKPSNAGIQSLNIRLIEKENQLTSTPLSADVSGNSPIRKLESLRDLSNITPNNYFGSPYKSEVGGKQNTKSMPSQYASTLPTFEVEYSPCALVPGPILALRGIGIADTYFEKPRYLNQEYQEPIKVGRNLADKISKNIGGDSNSKCEDPSMISSAKMGDRTLERMIDAILASAQKERKVQKSSKPSRRVYGMSPTYTPGDDPASDLHEFWSDSHERNYQTKETESHRNCTLNCNEHEIRPAYLSHNKTYFIKRHDQGDFKLRRQRAVRRKRNMAVVNGTSIVRASAQKIFCFNGALGSGRNNDNNSYPCSCEVISLQSECHNVSPDSGRNSPSDCEDLTLEEKKSIDCFDGKDNMFESAKRRLMFSMNINE